VLLPRLRREIGIVRSRRSRWAVAAAAAAVVVVGLGAWNTMLNLEVGDLNQQQAEVFDALRFAGEEGVSTFNVATAVPRRESLVIIYERNATDVTLAGHNMPVPASGSVYRLWVGRDGDFLFVNEFVPEDGVVLEALEFEAGRWEEVLVTEEPAGQEATSPSGSPRWHAFIRHDEDPDQP